jgi:hypothetical protein
MCASSGFRKHLCFFGRFLHPLFAEHGGALPLLPRGKPTLDRRWYVSDQALTGIAGVSLQDIFQDAFSVLDDTHIRVMLPNRPALRGEPQDAKPSFVAGDLAPRLSLGDNEGAAEAGVLLPSVRPRRSHDAVVKQRLNWSVTSQRCHSGLDRAHQRRPPPTARCRGNPSWAGLPPPEIADSQAIRSHRALSSPAGPCFIAEDLPTLKRGNGNASFFLCPASPCGQRPC